ncbi:hypothetical protein B0A52_00207 [Exophiala mesophila]|uniref:Mitochondrial inner membrane protein 1 n=1 Tax=Exophiala mesophila TaxID=212818 RepID=A0A438NJD6_EXOME|nr:hypothetical protein B0A52_00207 [Exophiala mesophila]
MFRTTATRSLPRSLNLARSSVVRSNLCKNVLKATLKTSARPVRASNFVALTAFQPAQKSMVRYAHVAADYDIKKAEAALAEQKITATPESVSAVSSISPVAGGSADHEQDVDMMAGIRGDFNTIKDTFSLKEVPREALYVGMAGVLPYLATSLTTVYLSFDIQYAAHHGQGYFLSGETAEQLLHLIEPIQLGYGASIISFLGAIHWGLEWAKFGGVQGYNRYSMGILATAVAWPTLLLSAEVGLITQFLAFTFLYYNDAKAARAGWAPAWYGTYRFVLTFVVGASIVASLIGRGQIADLVTPPDAPANKLKMLRAQQLDEVGPEPEADEEEAEEEDEE